MVEKKKIHVIVEKTMDEETITYMQTDTKIT